MESIQIEFGLSEFSVCQRESEYCYISSSVITELAVEAKKMEGAGSRENVAL